MIKSLARSATVGTAITRGFQLYKENFVLILVVTLISGLITAVSCGICAGALQCGVIGICLALLRGQDPKPQIGDLFNGFHKFLPAFVASLALSVIVFVVNCVLNVIPILGLLASIVVSSFISPAVTVWAMFLIQDQDATIGEAISTPLKLVGDGRFWSIILVCFLATLLGLVGLLACGIGLIVTLPFSTCMIAAAYEEVYNDAIQVEASSPLPPSEPQA